MALRARKVAGAFGEKKKFDFGMLIQFQSPSFLLPVAD